MSWINFCNRFHIPIAWQDIQTTTLNGQYFPWNGKGLCLLYHPWGGAPRLFDNSSQWHDIGHWLISKPALRKYPHMGANALDEVTASLIGIFLHMRVGGASPEEARRYTNRFRDITGRAQQWICKLSEMYPL